MSIIIMVYTIDTYCAMSVISSLSSTFSMFWNWRKYVVTHNWRLISFCSQQERMHAMCLAGRSTECVVVFVSKVSFVLSTFDTALPIWRKGPIQSTNSVYKSRLLACMVGTPPYQLELVGLSLTFLGTNPISFHCELPTRIPWSNT
jgi:hypothetical protein